jgi:hypothetical protein
MDVLCRQSDRARSCRWGRAALAVAARGSASTVDLLAASVLATRGGALAALAVAVRGGAPIVDLLAALGGERSHGGAVVGCGRKRRETRGEKKGGEWVEGAVTLRFQAWHGTRGGVFKAGLAELTCEARFGLRNWAGVRGNFSSSWECPGEQTRLPNNNILVGMRNSELGRSTKHTLSLDSHTPSTSLFVSGYRSFPSAQFESSHCCTTIILHTGVAFSPRQLYSSPM